MDTQDTKSIRSIEAQSIVSMGSASANQQVPYNFFSGPKDNVKVVIRVRPLNDKEKSNNSFKLPILVGMKPVNWLWFIDNIRNKDNVPSPDGNVPVKELWSI